MLHSKAISAVKGLFGGSEQDPASVYGAQAPFLKDLYQRAQDASGGNQGQAFGQKFEAPTLGAFNQLAAGGSMIPGLQQGLQNFGGQQNEALGGAIDSGLWQINNNLQRNILPSINQGAAESGTAGGSRQGIAQGLAMSDANQQSTNFINEMQSGNWAQQMQNQLGAYQGLAGLQGQRNAAMGGAMTAAPNVANLGFGNQYGNLQNYKDLIGGPTVLGGGGKTNAKVLGSIDPVTAMKALSDRRLKENIVKIGKTDGGTNLYRYNYKWSPQVQIGVMADEVDPSITIDVGGYKAVDYSKVK